MGVAVLAGLDKHSGLWNGSAVAVARHGELKGILAGLGKADGEQMEAGSGGERIGKVAEKRALAEMADIVCNGVMAYAKDVNDHVVYAEFGQTEAMIFAMKDVDCLAFCKGLKKYVDLHAGALGDYNITSGVIGELGSAIDDFRGDVSAPALAEAKLHRATVNAKEGIANLLKVLVWWDAFVGTLRRSQPSFYTAYKSARKIHNIGRRRVSIRGKVMVDGLEVPLFKVKVRVEDRPETGKTGRAGKFMLYSLGPGVFTLVFALKGYEPLRLENVAVVAGKITELEVGIVKIAD